MTEQEITRQIESMQLVYIDGVALDFPKPAPPYTFSKKELDYDSGRNILGIMERNVLEHHTRTLDLTFNDMNGDQMSRLLQLVDKSTLQVTAYDPWYNELRTYTMMHGDLTPKITMFDWDYTQNKVIARYEPFTIQLVGY